MDNLVFYLETQEKDGYHVFELNKDTTIDVYGLDDLEVGKESESRITPHAEGWQGVVWHLLVNAINQ